MSRSRTTAWTSSSSCAEGAIDIANRLGLPLVATCDAHYLCAGRQLAHDVLLCINTGKTRSDENRMRYGSDQFYVRPPEEMYRLFPGHEDAVQRSQEIADGCRHPARLQETPLPRLHAARQARRPSDYLRELCRGGPARPLRRQPVASRCCDRLEHELGIICRMGFASYFLIVWDFVRFAVENGIPGQRPRLGVRRHRQLRPASSATSIRWSTTCCSSASSIPTAARRPTSTSTSARIAAKK